MHRDLGITDTPLSMHNGSPLATGEEAAPSHHKTHEGAAAADLF
jgi:hypothetical protein